LHPASDTLLQIAQQLFGILWRALADDMRDNQLALGIQGQKQVLAAAKRVIRDVGAVFAANETIAPAASLFSYLTKG
jgi:hypothetical protein